MRPEIETVHGLHEIPRALELLPQHSFSSFEHPLAKFHCYGLFLFSLLVAFIFAQFLHNIMAQIIFIRSRMILSFFVIFGYSGPARFDWDTNHKHWVYRRTKARLLDLLEKEMNQLLGASITFSAFKQQ